VEAGRQAQQDFFAGLFRGLTREELDIWQEILDKVCQNIDRMETE